MRRNSKRKIMDPIAYAWEMLHGVPLPDALREKRWQLIEGKGLEKLTSGVEGCEVSATLAQSCAKEPRPSSGASSFLESPSCR